VFSVLIHAAFLEFSKKGGKNPTLAGHARGGSACAENPEYSIFTIMSDINNLTLKSFIYIMLLILSLIIGNLYFLYLV
jgi:hypothetical protein